MDKIELYVANDDSYTEEEKRKIAVEAALKVINSAAVGDGKIHGPFANLSHYADQIQEALKVSK